MSELPVIRGGAFRQHALTPGMQRSAAISGDMVGRAGCGWAARSCGPARPPAPPLETGPGGSPHRPETGSFGVAGIGAAGPLDRAAAPFVGQPGARARRGRDGWECGAAAAARSPPGAGWPAGRGRPAGSAAGCAVRRRQRSARRRSAARPAGSARARGRIRVAPRSARCQRTARPGCRRCSRTGRRDRRTGRTARTVPRPVSPATRSPADRPPRD